MLRRARGTRTASRACAPKSMSAVDVLRSARERRSHHPRVSRRPPHRRHLRHFRGAQARLPQQRYVLVQPRPGPAGDRSPAGGAAARARSRRARRRSGVRARGGVVGAARGRRRALQPPLSQRPAFAVRPRERQHLRRWAGGAHPRRGIARPRQPRPLPPRLHRVRGVARRLQGVHRHPHPPRRRARIRLHGRRSSQGDPGARTLRAPLEQSLQSDRQADPRGRAIAVGAHRARAGVLVPHRRVLLALRLDRAAGTAPDRERRPLRRGRQPRSRGDLRRPDEKLAVPGLARHLDRRSGQGDRCRGQRGIVSRRGWLAAAAARGDPAARRRGGAQGDPGDQCGVSRQAGQDDPTARAPGHSRRSRARRDLLCLGKPRGPPAAAQRRNGVLPRRAGEEGDHRARRVLRREPREAAQPPGFAIPQLYAVLVRSCAAAARRSDDEDRAAGPGSLKCVSAVSSLASTERRSSSPAGARGQCSTRAAPAPFVRRLTFPSGAWREDMFFAVPVLVAAAQSVLPVSSGNALTLPAARHVLRLDPGDGRPATWLLAVQQGGANGHWLSLYRSTDEARSWSWYAPIRGCCHRDTPDLIGLGMDVAMVYSYEGPQVSGSTEHDVYFQRWRWKGSAEWGADTPVAVFDSTSNATAYLRAELARDSQGRLWVWAQRLNADGSFTMVISVSTDGGATFQPQPSLDTFANRPGGRILPVAGNRLMLLYGTHNGGLGYMRLRNDSDPLQNWGARQLVFPEGIYHGAALSAAGDGSGGVHLVYKDVGGQLWYRHWSGGWSARVLVESTADWALQPAITRVGGSLVIFWNREIGRAHV